MKCNLNLFNNIQKKIATPIAASLITLPVIAQTNSLKKDVFEKSDVKIEQTNKAAEKSTVEDNEFIKAVKYYNELDSYERSNLTYQVYDSISAKLYKMEQDIDKAFINCDAYKDICIAPRWHYRYYPNFQDKLINFDIKEIRTKTDKDMKSLQDLKNNIEYSVENANGEKKHTQPDFTNYDVDELAIKHLGMGYEEFDKKYHKELEYCKTVTPADFHLMNETQAFVYGKAKAYAKEMLETTISEARTAKLDAAERILEESNKSSEDMFMFTDFEMDGITNENWAKLKSGIAINSFKNILKKKYLEKNPSGIFNLNATPAKKKKSIKIFENGNLTIISPNGLKYKPDGSLNF